jgi:hypothetical protein
MVDVSVNAAPAYDSSELSLKEYLKFSIFVITLIEKRSTCYQ